MCRRLFIARIRFPKKNAMSTSTATPPNVPPIITPIFDPELKAGEWRYRFESKDARYRRAVGRTWARRNHD